MAEDFMHRLMRVIKFDPKQAGDDIALFKNKRAKPLAHDSSELRFFNTSATKDSSDEKKAGKVKKKAKKVRRAAAAASIEDPVAHRATAFRKQHHIHVKGSSVPDPVASFAMMERLGVPSSLLKVLQGPSPNGCGFQQPTPVQMQAIPALLHNRDVLAFAPTGSGKTAAFLVPILTKLKKPAKKGIRALIVSPTRELAQQTFRVVQTLAAPLRFRCFLLNKANATKNTFGPQASKRRDVLVATPMRLLHLLAQDAIQLSSVRYLVLDEADRLFDSKFVDQIDTVMAACTHKRLRVSFFSATMLPVIEETARTIVRDPVTISVGVPNAAATSVDQRLMFVGGEDGKIVALRQLLQRGELELPVLVFLQSKQRAQELFMELVYDGLHVDVIHSERSQAQRNKVVTQFRTGEIWVLLCTDLMARGIDFKGVNTVINYDFPQSAVSYIHRIGRTGRAGRRGKAVTFFTEADTELLRSIANVVKVSGSEVPDWMLALKKIRKDKRKKLERVPPRRKTISSDPRKRRWKEHARGEEEDEVKVRDEKEEKPEEERQEEEKPKRKRRKKTK